MKLLYGGKEFCSTKTELINFMLALPSTKVDMIGARLGSNGLMFFGDIPLYIQLVTL